MAAAMELGSDTDPWNATFSVSDEDHTLGNSLRFVLNKDPRVAFCGYSVPHPSENRINVRVQTTGVPARDVLKDGLTDLTAMNQHVMATFERAVESFKANQGMNELSMKSGVTSQHSGGVVCLDINNAGFLQLMRDGVREDPFHVPRPRPIPWSPRPPEREAHHLSSWELLRAEVKKGTKTGLECEQLMKDGKLVPVEVTLELIGKAMAENKKTSNGFLIDGFPRAVDQAELFEKMVGRPRLVICLECPKAVMEERLLKRGETSGRGDDNQATITKRFNTFLRVSMPVVKFYEKMEPGVDLKVSSVPPPDEVYKEIHLAITAFRGETEDAITCTHLTPDPRGFVVHTRAGARCSRL